MGNQWVFTTIVTIFRILLLYRAAVDSARSVRGPRSPPPVSRPSRPSTEDDHGRSSAARAGRPADPRLEHCARKVFPACRRLRGGGDAVTRVIGRRGGS